EGVCIGLVIRDTAMIASGVPRRLRPGVAALLWLELGASVIAAVTGLGPLVKRGSAGATGSRLDALEIARRASVGALFGLHTIRFGIYLRPDRGRRTPAA
ncbi:MAG: hypothetical protein ACXVBY_08640, partial [Isosphaeraceae bacterium]